MNISDIKPGRRYRSPGGGVVVTVESVDEFFVRYYWLDESGVKKVRSKSHLAFQCRYCLILSDKEIAMTKFPTLQQYACGDGVVKGGISIFECESHNVINVKCHGVWDQFYYWDYATRWECKMAAEKRFIELCKSCGRQ